MNITKKYKNSLFKNLVNINITTKDDLKKSSFAILITHKFCVNTISV